MGQTFIYANLHLREFFDCWSLGTDGKFFCNAHNTPGAIFQLLTVVGLQPGGTAEVPAKPVTSISNRKYNEMLAEWVGRWAGHPAIQIGEYTPRETFGLLLSDHRERREFLGSVLRDGGKLTDLPPLSWIRTQYADITKKMVSLAKAVGLITPLPGSVYELAQDVEPYLRNRLLFDWRRAKCHPKDLRWMHPSDLEAYLSRAKSRQELDKLKKLFRACVIDPVHERILQHFVWYEPPHYGELYRSGKRTQYSAVHADEMRRRAYGDWGLTPAERAELGDGSGLLFRRLPEPPISTPLPRYRVPRGEADAELDDQLRHLDLGGESHGP